MTQARKTRSRLRGVESREKPIHRLFFKSLVDDDFPFKQWKLSEDQVKYITCVMTGGWTPAAPYRTTIRVGNLPAGFTYLSQMITHDIVQNTNDLDGRYVSPFLNLDSMYPCWHANNAFRFINADGSFRLSKRHDPKLQTCFYDYARCKQNDLHVALIPEARNDENIILASVVIFWMRLHNRLIEYLKCQKPELPPYKAYSLCQGFVLHTFHKVVIHELLASILDRKVFDYYFGSKSEKKLLLLDRNNPSDFQVPIEFSNACFRFGHAMVRDKYKLNSFDADDTPVLEIFKRNQVATSKIDLSFFFDEFPFHGCGKPKVQKAFRIQLDLSGALTQIQSNKIDNAGDDKECFDQDICDCLKSYDDGKPDDPLRRGLINLIGLDIEASESVPTFGDLFNLVKKDKELEKHIMCKFDIERERYSNALNFGYKFDRLGEYQKPGTEKYLDMNNAPLWLAVLREVSIGSQNLSESSMKSGGADEVTDGNANESYGGDRLGAFTSLIVAEVLYKSIIEAKCKSPYSDENNINIQIDHPLKKHYTVLESLGAEVSMAEVARIFSL